MGVDLTDAIDVWAVQVPGGSWTVRKMEHVIVVCVVMWSIHKDNVSYTHLWPDAAVRCLHVTLFIISLVLAPYRLHKSAVCSEYARKCSWDTRKLCPIFSSLAAWDSCALAHLSLDIPAQIGLMQSVRPACVSRTFSLLILQSFLNVCYELLTAAYP